MKEEIIKLISKATKIKEAEVEALIETPPNPEIGDYAFPCFTLAKKFKKNPVNIAEDLANKIKPKSPIESIQAKGPYLNFFIDKREFTKTALANINKKYGSSKLNKETIMIEFSQANTHKAFHVGHIRGTSLGESLARILEFTGNKVIRANYQGDTGMHVAKWIWCYQKYHSKEKLQEDEQWIASIYVDAIKRLANDEDLQEEVNEINKKLEEKKDKKLVEIWKKTRKLSLDSLEKIYKELNTKFDKYYFEGEVEKPAKTKAKELVKKKIAEISEGATIVNLEDKGLSVIVLLRTDGTVLYGGKDLVLAEKKFKDYKLDKSLYIVADEQNLHIKQVFKILELDKFKQANKLKHVAYGLVRLPTGKMSSRTGENIIYSDFKSELVEFAKKGIKEKWSKLSKKELEQRALKIAMASMKYSMLSQDSNKVIIFDKENSMKFEGETGPYLLYSYARASSILRKSKKKPKLIIPAKIEEKENKLIKKLAEFPTMIKRASTRLNPALIAHYAYQLSQTFNEFYHANKVIDAEEESFRLALVDAFRTTLKQTLSLLGIDVLEEM